MASKSDEKFIHRCELIYFAEDLINKRNLDDKDFFSFIKTKYENIREFRRDITFCREVLSSELANQMEVILNYKLASLHNDEEALKKYREDFFKIKNVKFNFGETSYDKPKGSICFTKAKSYERAGEKPELIDKALKSYINNENLEQAKSILKIDSKLSEYIKTNLNYISDYEQYVEFYIKYYKIKKININELNELIIVLNFFLQNLKDNYSKLIIYRTNPKYYEKEIRNMKVDKTKDLSSFVVDNISRLCQYKLKRIDAIYQSYDEILKYFEKLKSFLEEKSKIPKAVSYHKLVNIKEEFLNNEYKIILEFFRNYKSISVTDKINDDDIEKIRNLYLEKVIEN